MWTAKNLEYFQTKRPYDFPHKSYFAVCNHKETLSVYRGFGFLIVFRKTKLHIYLNLFAMLKKPTALLLLDIALDSIRFLDI